MASKGFSRSFKALKISIGASKDPLIQCLAPRLCRTMATEASLNNDASQRSHQYMLQSSAEPTAFQPVSEVLTTIYQFPTMEPLRFESHPAKHLYVPLRRDILHRAVIFEGDATRQGTASSKTRYQVHGSHRKIRPQKGTGMARLGTKQSPMLKGGGKTFGPHPRNFATGLPRKVYDLAWRTALSYRYRKGELIVCEDGMEIEHSEPEFLKQIFEYNRWGNEFGRSLVITRDHTKNLFAALGNAGEDGRALTEDDVDVKDLLGMGRIIIEKRALDKILREHRSDLVNKVARA